MPQSSRTMVTLAASCFHRAASASLAPWKPNAADAATRIKTSCFTYSFFMADPAPFYSSAITARWGRRFRLQRPASLHQIQPLHHGIGNLVIPQTPAGRGLLTPMGFIIYESVRKQSHAARLDASRDRM